MAQELSAPSTGPAFAATAASTPVRTPVPSSPGLVVRIAPSRGWAPLRLGALWEYRELLYFLAWRDIKVRYKQTALGVAWALIQPLATMAVFALFLGRLAGLPSDGLPYPVFAYSALLLWGLFARALTDSGNSLVGSQHLITKVYFPRLILPIAPLLAALVDCAVALPLLVCMMAGYGIAPTWTLLAAPVFLLFAFVTALSVGLWLAALNVEYRDVRHTLPFLTQVWLFLTPVAYPSSLVPAAWRPLYGLNPMTGAVDGFRWALFGRTPPAPGAMAVSLATVALLLVGSLYYFRRMERTFADRV